MNSSNVKVTLIDSTIKRRSKCQGTTLMKPMIARKVIFAGTTDSSMSNMESRRQIVQSVCKQLSEDESRPVVALKIDTIQETTPNRERSFSFENILSDTESLLSVRSHLDGIFLRSHSACEFRSTSASPSRKIICNYTQQTANSKNNRIKSPCGTVISQAVFQDESDPSVARTVLWMKKPKACATSHQTAKAGCCNWKDANVSSVAIDDGGILCSSFRRVEKCPGSTSVASRDAIATENRSKTPEKGRLVSKLKLCYEKPSVKICSSDFIVPVAQKHSYLVVNSLDFSNNCSSTKLAATTQNNMLQRFKELQKEEEIAASCLEASRPGRSQSNTVCLQSTESRSPTEHMTYIFHRKPEKDEIDGKCTMKTCFESGDRRVSTTTRYLANSSPSSPFQTIWVHRHAKPATSDRKIYEVSGAPKKNNSIEVIVS